MTRHRVLIIDPQFATDPDIERTVLPASRFDISIWRPEGGEAVPHALLGATDAILNCRSRHGLKGAAEIIYRSELSDPEKIKGRVKDYEARFANPFVAAQRGFLDEVIMPHSTRKRLARALNMLRHKKLENPWKKHDNIPL